MSHGIRLLDYPTRPTRTSPRPFGRFRSYSGFRDFTFRLSAHAVPYHSIRELPKLLVGGRGLEPRTYALSRRRSAYDELTADFLSHNSKAALLGGFV